MSKVHILITFYLALKTFVRLFSSTFLLNCFVVGVHAAENKVRYHLPPARILMVFQARSIIENYSLEIWKVKMNKWHCLYLLLKDKAKFIT